MFLFLINLVIIRNLIISETEHNPNNLQSFIIMQSADKSTLYIDNSNFIGSHDIIYTYSGSINIINSTFETSYFALDVIPKNGMILRDCKFINIGQYHGIFISDEEALGIITPGLRI